MKKNIYVLIFILLQTPVFAQKAKPAPDRPSLVVGLVVDQMRWDYLYRYYEKYSSNGFKRLINKGFSCEQTLIPYLPTYTAPGHTCIYTGSVPAIHGIAGNDWTDRNTGRDWYCTEDTTVTSVGGSRSAGAMSPRNMLVTTITDELRLATMFRSRVYGIAIKDRGAILPAGHLANGAYWYDDSTGNFISSTYYKEPMPSWLQRFNNRHLPDSLLSKNWLLRDPPASYTESMVDSNRFEGLFKGEKASVFPHITDSFAGRNYGMIRKIPAGNTITLEAAKACLTGAKLGQGTTTDFLCVSLSSTDYIGHMYGPDAMEVEDTYLKLDEEIGKFLDFLDKQVGKGNYVLFLTADHGGAHNSEYMKSINIPAGNMGEKDMAKQINAELEAVGKFGKSGLVRSIDNGQIYLDEQQIKSTGLDRQKIKDIVMSWLALRSEISFVADLENIWKTPLPEPLPKMIINGYNKDRSGCITFILNPAWYNSSYKTGTTHGSWNPYDAHIPLLWYGWHIPKGKTYENVYMTDIAPTLAALLHIQMPNGNVGKVINLR